jgi:hypothetical protein
MQIDVDGWWGVIERARAVAGDRAEDRNPPDDPLPDALVDELTTLTPAELVDWWSTSRSPTAPTPTRSGTPRT